MGEEEFQARLMLCKGLVCGAPEIQAILAALVRQSSNSLTAEDNDGRIS